MKLTNQNDWFCQIPKAELHLHLEEAIPIPCLWELVQKYDATSEVSSLSSLLAKFKYKG